MSLVRHLNTGREILITYAERLHYVDICLKRKISLMQSSKSPHVLLQICNHTHAILLLLFYLCE